MLPSLVDEPEPLGDSRAARPTLVVSSRRRPLNQLMHIIRRGHLYLGLFLFPWAILYGVTAFLFNHPTAFSDAESVTFGRDAVIGTPMESLPSPAEQAEQVVARLNQQQSPATPYRLAGEARYSREFAFATVKAGGQSISVLVNIKGDGGTIRVSEPTAPREPDRAPFVTGPPQPMGRAGRGGREARPRRDDGIRLDDPIPDRVKAAVPTILTRSGFDTGEVTVTSVPDLVFPVEADGRTWTTTYNAMTGSVSARAADAATGTELSVRRFLLRLHTAHGYPSETNARWFWAVIVDVMAAVMCFWGFSGLLMWWQIKATRRFGFAILATSAIAATALGWAMHAAMVG